MFLCRSNNTFNISYGRSYYVAAVMKQVHAELTALGTPLQFARYVGMAVVAVFKVVVYVSQNFEAELENLEFRRARRQLFALQTSGGDVVVLVGVVLVQSGVTVTVTVTVGGPEVAELVDGVLVRVGALLRGGPWTPQTMFIETGRTVA
jgi:hypothetical protein